MALHLCVPVSKVSIIAGCQNPSWIKAEFATLLSELKSLKDILNNSASEPTTSIPTYGTYPPTDSPAPPGNPPPGTSINVCQTLMLEYSSAKPVLQCQRFHTL